jgi:hypothetical protein
MGVKLGLDAKLYFCAAGIGGTPTWTLLGNVKNLTLNLAAYRRSRARTSS